MTAILSQAPAPVSAGKGNAALRRCPCDAFASLTSLSSVPHRSASASPARSPMLRRSLPKRAAGDADRAEGTMRYCRIENMALIAKWNLNWIAPTSTSRGRRPGSNQRLPKELKYRVNPKGFTIRLEKKLFAGPRKCAVRGAHTLFFPPQSGSCRAGRAW